ncbi:ribonuclease H-like protein [Exidia glandulosa HHB12029]|uniref:Ribonuclease H-like protein n=1 Tax=Exidia glandulosa HHB12029 TaxID=1314781 RepID=A0A166BV87_EXIGL|nr:ribonuclease H-like protein [Exidia glandulosa HHB12029]
MSGLPFARLRRVFHSLLVPPPHYCRSMSSAATASLARSASFPQGPASGAGVQRTGSRYTLEELQRLAPFRVPTAISVVQCHTHEDANRELKHLEPGYVSFDMEWHWNPQTKITGRIALVQVADRKRAVLVRTTRMDELPPVLVSLLQDPTLLKVGVNIRGDGRKVFEDYGVVPVGLFELSRAALLVDVPFWSDRDKSRLISLQHLTAKYLNAYLAKDEQQSDWEQELTPEQLSYAAADAVAGMLIFDAMLVRGKQVGIDLSSRRDCLVKYDDPDPYKNSTSAPVRKTYSAPAIVAPMATVAPVNGGTTIVLPLQVAPALAARAPSRSPTPELTPEDGHANGISAAQLSRTTSAPSLAAIHVQTDRTDDDNLSNFSWSAEDEEAMQRLEQSHLAAGQNPEPNEDKQDDADDEFILTEEEEAALAELESPTRKRAASIGEPDLSPKRPRTSAASTVSLILNEVPSSNDST